MAEKKTRRAEDALPDESDMGLDRAIDDLRGVLKQDSEGLASPDDNAETEGTTMAGTDKAAAMNSDFGSDFGADFGSDDAGMPDFAGTAAGDSLDMLLRDGPAFDDEPAAALAAPAGAKPSFDDFGEKPFDAAAAGDRATNMDIVMDIPIDMEIVLGTSRLPVSGLMSLTEGSLIALDRKIGEPVEIMVNGRLFGRGEITVLEGDQTRFGVKLIEIIGQIKS